MRRTVFLLPLGGALVGLALAFVVPPTSPPAGSLRAQGPAIYLPLALAMQRLDDLPVIPTAPATLPPTAGPTEPPPTDAPTATDEPPRPTATDEPPTATSEPPTATTEPPTSTSEPPTASPTPKGGGEITGRLVVDGKPAVEELGLYEPGPGLVLRRCRTERDCVAVARSGVTLGATDGAFAFEPPAPLPADEYYQVAWINENPVGNETSPYAGADLWLGAWYSAPIRPEQVGQSIDLGTIELADVIPTRPTHGTGFSGLPIQFGWEARQNETGDYMWSLCEECCQTLSQRIGHHHTPSLGRQTSYALNAYPPGTRIGIDYKHCWFIRVQDAGGAHGESYRIRMLWFFLAAFEPFGLVDRDDWQSYDRPPAAGRGDPMSAAP